MKYMLFIIVTLFASTHGYADDAFFSYGVGIGDSAQYSPTETKILDIGYRRDIYSGIYWNYEGGGWLDSSGNPNRLSSFFGSTGPGFKVDLHPVEIRNSIGIAAITGPDSYLGGPFPQFHDELYLGVRGNDGNGIGLKYNHFSSAGLVTPNIGRDFILLELSQHW